MITIRTLENVKTAKLLAVFNQSFADYLIPLSLTKEQLEEKIETENIQLEYSTGVFKGDELAGFILHGDKLIGNHKILYNAGTGIIPDERGQQLTAKMYDYLLPKLRSLRFQKILLEVITENKPALKTYERIGFKKVRKLDCYKGVCNPSDIKNDYEIKELDIYEWDKLTSFWDITPSWQNAITVADKLKESNISIGLYQAESLLGYLIYNPKSKRIQQFAIHKNHRNMGLGKALFSHICSNYPQQISIINVEDHNKAINTFIDSLGLTRMISQYEMVLDL